MSTNQLYNTWYKEMRELRPSEHTSRLRSFVWLLVGLFLAQTVHLSKIGMKIPGSATHKSKERRVQRIVDNPAIRVRRWYAPWITAILEQIVAHNLPVRLIVDGSKVGFGHQLLMVAVAYRRRAIPVAWTWVKGSRGHSSSWKQLALLSYVRGLIPAGATVSLVGDSEFGAIPVLKWLDKAGWQYVLRQKGNHLVQLPNQRQWQRFDGLISRHRQCVWIPQALLTENHAYGVNLLAYWKSGEKEPWLLATNYTEVRAALRAYRKRMWIEEMFGDFKGHGFDLETTHLHHFLRLARLTLAVALLYLWLVAYGSKVIKDGRRYLVDRKDRCDLSIFRIGLDMIERHFTNQEAFGFRWLPYF
jgi:hypothetical protein